MAIIIIFHGYKGWLGSTSQFLLSFSHAVIDSGWGWDHLKPAQSYMWHHIKKTWSAGGWNKGLLEQLYVVSAHVFPTAWVQDSWTSYTGAQEEGERERENQMEVILSFLDLALEVSHALSFLQHSIHWGVHKNLPSFKRREK